LLLLGERQKLNQDQLLLRHLGGNADLEFNYSLSPQSSREILLYKEDFQDQGLSTLDNKGEITHVRFGSEENEHWVLTDEDLLQLRELKNLTSIDLTNCGQITRRGLQSFSLNPGQIKSLILTDCPKITDRFCDHIVHYTSLERLDVRGCFRISDNGVGALTSLRYLKHLDLSVGATVSSEGNNQSISDVSMHTLAQMPQLASLQLEGCASITDKGLIRLAALRNLTFLNVSSTGITDEGLSIIHHLPKLCVLEIGSCHLTQTALLSLAQNKSLTRLNLADVPGVTDRVVEALSKSLDLHHLDVSGCHSLTDLCLKHIGRFRNLVKLTANRCTGDLNSLSRATSVD